jgi:putative acetyltransferase
MLIIRAEQPDDLPAIQHIHTAAFGRPNEADLVDRLRDHHVLTISLVAVQDGHLVGYTAFSRVTITSSTATIEA